MRLRERSLALLATLLWSAPPFAAAETFESLSYTPPVGWAVQNTPEGRMYVGKDANGIGAALIAVYASQPGTPAASQAFAAYWRMHIEKALPGPPPEPTLGRQGE